MELLPLLLFICGCICLYWAFKMGNPSGKSSPETLTILQGVAKVKKEVSQGQKSLREVQSQLGDHELRLYRVENVQEELRGEIASLRKELARQGKNPPPQPEPVLTHQGIAQRVDQRIEQRIDHKVELRMDQKLNSHGSLMDEQYPSMANMDLNTGQPLPEKYRKVLDLSQL